MAYATRGDALSRAFRGEERDAFAGWPPRGRRFPATDLDDPPAFSSTVRLLRGVLRSFAGAAHKGLKPELEGR
jgi:hypothetical protein